MANKKFDTKELAKHSIIFGGYPHRRHRTGKKKTQNGRKVLINKVLDKEHHVMMSKAT